MAVRKTHGDQYQKPLPRLKHKFFGANEDGRSFGQAVKNGVKRSMAFGLLARDSEGQIATSALQGLFVFMPCVIVGSTFVDRVDFDVPHDARLFVDADISDTGGYQIYGVGQQHYFEDGAYMLVNGEDGYQLYSAGAQERTGPDNRFSLVSDHLEASEIAAGMLARFQYEADADKHPTLMEYEGVSPLYEEDKDHISEIEGLYTTDLRHRIADNFESEVIHYDTAGHEAAWQAALAQFTGGENPAYDMQAAELSDHYDGLGRELLEMFGTWLAVYGGLAGLGAAGGAIAGVNGSRRRFNADVKKAATPKMK